MEKSIMVFLLKKIKKRLKGRLYFLYILYMLDINDERVELIFKTFEINVGMFDDKFWTFSIDWCVDYLYRLALLNNKYDLNIIIWDYYDYIMDIEIEGENFDIPAIECGDDPLNDLMEVDILKGYIREKKLEKILKGE